MDPISAALKKASRPIDMELPDGWFWTKTNMVHGYFLNYSKDELIYQTFFGYESLYDDDSIKKHVYDIIQSCRRYPTIFWGKDDRPNL